MQSHCVGERTYRTLQAVYLVELELVYLLEGCIHTVHVEHGEFACRLVGQLLVVHDHLSHSGHWQGGKHWRSESLLSCKVRQGPQVLHVPMGQQNKICLSSRLKIVSREETEPVIEQCCLQKTRGTSPRTQARADQHHKRLSSHSPATPLDRLHSVDKRLDPSTAPLAAG